MNIQYWKCKRCNHTVDMDAFKCRCVESPSPWETISAYEYFKCKMHEDKPERLKKWTNILDSYNPESADFKNNATLLYSPPYMPLHSHLQDLWSAILSLGIVDVEVCEKDGKLGIQIHTKQTVNLENKFYPINECGGDIQQKAFFGK